MRSEVRKTNNQSAFVIMIMSSRIKNRAGSRYFSVLDAKSGYWSIELTEESSYLCRFGSPQGRYRSLRLPYGVKSRQDEFQRRMDECLEGITGVKCIVDDILVHGKTRQEHDLNLRVVEKNGSDLTQTKQRSDLRKFRILVTSLQPMG